MMQGLVILVSSQVVYSGQNNLLKEVKNSKSPNRGTVLIKLTIYRQYDLFSATADFKEAWQP